MLLNTIVGPATAHAAWFPAQAMAAVPCRPRCGCATRRPGTKRADRNGGKSPAKQTRNANQTRLAEPLPPRRGRADARHFVFFLSRHFLRRCSPHDVLRNSPIFSIPPRALSCCASCPLRSDPDTVTSRSMRCCVDSRQLNPHLYRGTDALGAPR